MTAVAASETVKADLLDQRPKTGGYKPVAVQQYWRQPRDLPLFSFNVVRAMLMEPTIRLGLAMRSAPLYGLELAYKEGDKWVEGVEADDPVIGEFVTEQYRRIWLHGLDHLLTSQIWGWAAAEVMLRLNRHRVLEVDYFLPRHASDVRAMERQSELVGARFLRVKQSDKGHADLEFPKCVWHSYMPEPGTFYGVSALHGCYSPWADKWLDHGALDVRRLFMTKDAYGGADISYPEGVMQIDGKGEVPHRDVAREIVEQMQAGAVTTRPAVYDQAGNELWTITRATIPGNPEHILQFPKDLDVEILRGLEIPDDVLVSGDAGSWAGKRVPMAAFYGGLDRWALKLLQDIDAQIVAPLVALNWGPGKRYEVRHKPLAEQATENQGNAGPQSQPGQPAMNPRPYQYDRGDQGGEAGPQRMALDPVAAVGQGVLSAAELVQAARQLLPKTSEA